MMVYILDSLWRRQLVVDKFESLIWTERFSAYGDFELVVHSTLENRNRFRKGVRLAINESKRAMILETVENRTDDDGTALLKLKGRSLEAIMDSRLGRGALADLTTVKKWTWIGTPAWIATNMFKDICIDGDLDAGDIIPGVSLGSIFPADTIPPPPDTITYEVDPKSLYAIIKELCDIFLIGFRLVRDGDTSNLYYDVYSGSDRTTRQTTLPAVVFSPDFDNLKNTTELSTIATYKNVAYVISPVGSVVVYPLDVDPTVSGFDRQVLFVKADDITDTVPADATAKMTQRGLEELAKNRQLFAFDGEVSQTSQYKYGIDYNLGDLVELRNVDGVISNMQVTEQIFVSDKEGDRSYPTLSLFELIEPGTWLARPPAQVWQDVPDTEHWGDL